MDIIISSILSIAFVLFVVFVTRKYRRQNDYEKAVKAKYDFEEWEAFK